MQELLTKLIPNVMDRLPTFFEAIGDTLLMVVWSGAISFVLGLALGVLITVTKPGGILENKVAYQILDKVISLFRSIPFIILLTWVMPVSRAIMGTAIYVQGAIVPLVFGAVPFFARQVQGALAELDPRTHRSRAGHGFQPLGDHLPGISEGERGLHRPRHHDHCHQPAEPHRHGGAWSAPAAWVTSPSATATIGT